MRILRMLGWLVLGLALALVSAWCVLAILRAPVGAALPREALAGLFGLTAVGVLIGMFVPRWRTRSLGVFLVAVIAFAIGWSRIQPSNDRPWRAEEGLQAYAEIDGDRVTVHNIRNFQYRTETDFTPAYYDKTFDLRELDSVDLLAIYWMGPDIAHIMLSFGFAAQDYLTVSIEARKEQGEGYSTLDGFFRHFELHYVVADERDAIGVRAIHRKDPPEDVHMYRVQGPPEAARRLFLEYFRHINALREQPEFYNSLTTNCTSTIWMNARVNPQHVPFSWKIVLSGHVPEYLYEKGRLDATLPFEELQRRGRINTLAERAGSAPDFSQQIRVGLPGVVSPATQSSARQLTE